MKIETPKGRSRVPIINHPTILDGLFSLAGSLKAEPAISMALSMRDQATQKSLSAKQHLWIYRMLRQEQPDFPGLPSQDVLESYLNQRDEYLSGIGGGNIWNCSGQTPDADGTIWIAERTNFLGSKQFCLLIQYPYELSGERARLIKQIGTDHPGQPSTRYYWDRDNQVWVIQPCKDWDLNELLVEAVKSLPTFDVWGMAREVWERIQAEQSALIEQKRREDALRQELVGKTLPLAHSIYDRVIHEHGWSDLEHQREGYEFLLRNLKCLLADDMGVGKTIQSLTAAKAIQDAYGYPVMILAKASTTEKWKEEAGLVGLKCDVFTTHHASIPRHLESRKYVVISDETQAFKNPGSRRTKAWKDLVMHPNCIASWALSGTQVVNGDPMELWPILEMTGHPLATTQPRDKRLTPLKAYQRRYCQGGGSHLLELHQKIADDYPIMLRRTKEQVLTLPPDGRKLVEAQLTPDEQKVWNRRFGELEAEYWRRVQDGSISEIGRALVLLNNLRQAASTAKITSVLNLALALHEPEPGQHEPVAIFVEFLETGKALVSQIKELGYSAEMLDGSLNQVKRYDLNKRFQAGNLEFLVLSSGAGGVGINLTAANRSILADRPWNATDQLEDRLHRIGQTRPVCHYWVQATKVDAWIDQKLINKLERIGLMQDGQAQTLDGIKGMGALAIDFLKEIFD